MLGSDGFISLEAIRWLHRLGIALMHLDRDGNILATSAPNGGDVRLRRLQALVGGSETGIEIARMLLQTKLDGQAQTLERLNPDQAARRGIVRATAALGEASTLEQLLWAERDAALAYWSAWEPIPVTFARPGQCHVPEHWLRFGQRGSLLTSSPRLAINPANTILNYLYAILEAETRLACLTVGLDPGLGIVHVDHRSRDSFALDLMEAARPTVDAYLLELLQDRFFTRRDFAETARGVCRVNPPLSHELAETAQRWAEAIGPVAGPSPTNSPAATARGSSASRRRSPGAIGPPATSGRDVVAPHRPHLSSRGRCRPANAAAGQSPAAAAPTATTVFPTTSASSTGRRSTALGSRRSSRRRCCGR